MGDSGRRILWIVGLYRAICAAMLLGAALLLDPKTLNIAQPNAFITGTGLYFAFGVSAFWWVQQDRLPMPLPTMLFSLLAGDVFFLSLVMFAGGVFGAPLPILLFPQLAAAGWILRTQTAFFHAAFAAIALLGLDGYRALEGVVGGAQVFQTGIIGFGYFATVGIAVALGRYTKQSEELAAQRGIDVANLEQVNRLIIQDMQDGVLVVDLNGVVRGHNAQVTRLLGGFGRMRGGMRLAEFSTTLHDYWRRWQEDFTEPLPPFKVEATQRLLRVRLVRIGTGLNGGTLIYLEDLGRAQTEAQQMKLAAMGRLTASIAHEVRNPLSAINQASQLLEEDGAVAPEGARLLAMIRNNAKRIDRIVGEVLQLNRRDRQQPETVPFSDFMRALIDEIVQAENMPRGQRDHADSRRPAHHLRPWPSQPDRVESDAQRVAALPEEGRQHSRDRARRLHGRRGNLRVGRRRAGHSRRIAAADLRAVFHDPAGRHGARPLHRARAGRCQRRGARVAAQGTRRPFPDDIETRIDAGTVGMKQTQP